MASFDVAKLINKITQDIPGLNTVIKALANWDVSALTDVPDGAMQATTDASNRLTIKKKISGSYTPVAKLLHDVDTVDGYHASASATANAVAVRNSAGALPGNILGNAATSNTATALATGSVVPVNQGGTGATTASQARANLGVAGGADFTAHIAKQASPTVEGHVKLDALAADGSNTAAPGGFGLGATYAAQIPANTDLDTVVLPGFYSCKQSATATTLTNCPVAFAFSMLVEYGSYGPTQTITGYSNGAPRFQRTKSSSTAFSPWRSLPNGISDSTTTTSSTVAASATAVKAVNDAALDAQTDASTALARTAPATTTSRGIGRVATSADLVDGATITNGPAFLAAGVNTSVKAAAGKIPVADADGSLNSWAGARYAVCSTASATAAKVADLANFQLVKGSRVFVTFTNANTVSGALTLNVNNTGAKTIYNERGISSASNFVYLPVGVPIEFVYDGTVWRYLSCCSSLNCVLQQVRYQTGALASGSTLMPPSSSAPVNTQGTQFMSLEITPKSATSVLVIDVEAVVSFNENQHATMALFVDSVTNAISAVRFSVNNGWGALPTLKACIPSGSVTARTYKVRIGCGTSGTVYLNGTSGEGQYFGGVSSSTITITEYAA